MPATLVLRPHPKKGDLAIAVVVGGKLDGPAWGRYCAIGPFDRENTARSFKRAELAATVARLTGLPVTVDPALASGAEEARSAVLARVEAAETRVTAAEARSGRALYPFQRDGARWLASRQTAILADEMGTGKTAQSLIAASTRLVVVCPASLRQNWLREAAIWRPDLRGAVIDGVGAFRWPAEGEMVVIGYEGLPASAGELETLAEEKTAAERAKKTLAAVKAKILAAGLRTGSCPEGVTLIADEGHAFKGSVKKTARVERWRGLADIVKAHGGATWVLTATPLLNRPAELWNVGMCAGVAVEAFGSWRRFCEIAGGTQGRFAMEWRPQDVDHDALSDALRPVMLRRMKGDVLSHLPPKTRHDVLVSLVPNATEDKALTKAVGLLGDETDPEDLDPAFPGFRDLSRALAVLGALKYEASLDLLASYEDAEEPIVVFSTHVASVDALLAREGWVGFHGGTPEADRQKAVDAFQAGRAKGIALTIAAGGVGITLTRAKVAIFLERSWTPALDAQAEDRIHRIGQEAAHVTYVTVLADHPLDRRITDLQERKRRFTIGVDGASRAADEVAYVPPPALFGVDLDGTLAFDAWEAAYREEQAEIAAEQKRRRTETASERAERAATEKREKAARRKAERRAVIRAVQERTPTRRAPTMPEEVWLQNAMTALALMDEDHAMHKNEAGFSKSTGAVGHALAWTVDLGWTPAQLDEARIIARTHRGQVGTWPGAKAAKQAAE